VSVIDTRISSGKKNGERDFPLLWCAVLSAALESDQMNSAEDGGRYNMKNRKVRRVLATPC
jgi:hypothetical protein